MGLFTQKDVSAQRSNSMLNRSRSSCRKPASEAELDELIREMRAAFPDAARTNAQLEQGGEEGLTRVQCKRWLAARGWDPTRAAHDLAAHAAWRADFAPNGRVADADVAAQLAQRKVLYQGLDRQGRPVVVLVAGNHIPTADPADVQRFYCYASDACIANADPERNPEGRAVFVIDVGDFGWKNFDVLGAKALFGMMSHYVERLSHVYIHNAGALLLRLYQLVAPFIDPVTRGKVVFLPRDPAAAGEVLARDIDLHLLPPNLGGSSAPRPIEQAWADADARRAAAAAKAAAVSGRAPSTVDVTAACSNSGAVAAAALAAAFDDAMRVAGGKDGDGGDDGDDEGSEVWLDADDGSGWCGGCDQQAGPHAACALVGCRGEACSSGGGDDDALVDIDGGGLSAAAALAEKADCSAALRPVAVRA